MVVRREIAGLWTLIAGMWILMAGLLTLIAGLWTLVVGLWTLMSPALQAAPLLPFQAGVPAVAPAAVLPGEAARP